MSRLVNHAIRSHHFYRPGNVKVVGCLLPSSSASASRLLFPNLTIGQGKRSFFQGSLLWNQGSIALAGPTIITPTTEEEEQQQVNHDDLCHVVRSSLQGPFYQQVRWKRNVGHRFHMKPRPPTRKQRKRYNLKKQKLAEEAAKHGEPGSKAGPMREDLQRMSQEAIDEEEFPQLGAGGPSGGPEQLEQYGSGRALLESLIGNTKDCHPTPLPRYLGHKQQQFYNQVADTMKEFRRKMDLIGSQQQPNGSDGGDTITLQQQHDNKALVATSELQLPTDREISMALRAFRDRYGTRGRPVGLARALSHLLQDLAVPLGSLGDYSFNALLTCARTPKEARRVIDLMKQHNRPIGQYSWAILVDVYARTGDHQGCIAVHEEMASNGLSPVLASYTSLLAACYRVCANNSLSHKERLKAYQTGWEKWKEMIIVGIKPDVMAYGALLRLVASKGQPERALNILEEMAIEEVQPTTLCFTSALRAVAKSQQIATRFERGSSRRDMRREQITAHHGKLAQSIVIKAEAAGVEQDDGFVSALISCVGAAGDIATAKAIYVASQIRKLDQFRTIGPDDHLARLRGESYQDELGKFLSAEENEVAEEKTRVRDYERYQKSALRAFEKREYGKDSRVLSAIARACATASDAKDLLGTMWQGRENEGYLCVNSVRLLSTPGTPEYLDVDIPGAERSDYYHEEQDREFFEGKEFSRKHGQRPKGLIPEDDPSLTIYDLSKNMQDMILTEDGDKKPQYRNITFEEAWKMKYGKNDRVLREVRAAKGYLDSIQEEERLALSASKASTDMESPSESLGGSNALLGTRTNGQTKNEYQGDTLQDEDEPVFNYETMKWEKKTKVSRNSLDSNQKEVIEGEERMVEDINSIEYDGGDEVVVKLNDETEGWSSRAKVVDCPSPEHGTLADGEVVPEKDLSKRSGLREFEEAMFDVADDEDEKLELGTSGTDRPAELTEFHPAVSGDTLQTAEVRSEPLNAFELMMPGILHVTRSSDIFAQAVQIFHHLLLDRRLARQVHHFVRHDCVRSVRALTS